MAKSIKETLLGTLVHGEEILENIRVMREVSQDKITAGNEADVRIAPLHTKELNLVVNSVADTGKQAKVIRLSSQNGYLLPF